MIDFNNPIRQAGIRKMIRNEISKSINFSFKQINVNAQRLAEAFCVLGAYAYFCGISIKELGRALIIIKIARRIRIFEYINRGILKLWIGG